MQSSKVISQAMATARLTPQQLASSAARETRALRGLAPSRLEGSRLLPMSCSSSRRPQLNLPQWQPPSHGNNPRRRSHARATATKPAVAAPAEANPDFDWESFSGFGLKATDFMFVQKCEQGQDWQPGSLVPYGPLELSPSAGVLNYGQGVFEGMKAYRTEDGRLLLFRPEQNALRMQESADRMSMPAPCVEDFVSAVKQTVLANARWIPPAGKGSLYIRPLLIGSGPVLGLAAAPEYSFLVYVSPVGNYFSGAIDLKVEEKYHRAAPGGTGAAKAIGNYSPVLKTQLEAKQKGFSDVVYLDAVSNKFIEEVSSCNIFVIKDGKLATPDLKGTILPGITRKSIIEVARSLGHEVEERPVSVDELLAADEVFCTGTAVVVSPVASATYRGQRMEFSTSSSNGPTISQKLYQRLTGMQMGLLPDDFGWTVQLN